ncbi:flagellar basal-body MS-ring/collar protein FliF [Vulcaniibacterium thermophilum]|uniref:Flagellar M-ring protein n=2 Tax=Vulcaniibacterium thermophilum TaxID=1169913 RepID=A0A918Z508_9GAMM|nr:flagellar M-ring protein [Vulcaniibacterium thermophilum]
MAMGGALTRHLQDLPSLRQFVLLVGLAGAIAAGLWLFFWTQRPGYVPLFAELAPRDAAEVTEALGAAGIEYKLDDATGAVKVPEDKLHEARLKLASQGLPQQADRGFELIAKDPGFGVSQFVENARYQHALETELARTVATLRPVRSARVHLALPKPTAFARNRDQAGASVVLELFSGRTLDENQIAAIVNLVSSSIPNLPPERVTVVDQTGRLLTRRDGEQSAADAQFDQVRRMETAYVERVQQLLEPMLGPGRVSAQVTVDMDFSETEEAREVYGPDPGKVRSEQVAEEITGSAAPAAAGVPGATSNTPPGPPAPSANATAAAQEPAPVGNRNATRNYEIDRTISHSRRPAGRIRRVTAAVLVDNLPAAAGDGKKPASRPLTPAQVAQVEALVKQAIGFDANRGDAVTVANAPFVRNETPEGGEEPPLWENPTVQQLLRLGVGALAVLALVFGVLRPTLRQIVAPRAAAALPAAALEGTLEPAAALASPDGAAPAAAMRGPAPGTAGATDAGPTTHEARLQQARSAVAQDPKRVAQVVKAWVGSDG